LQQVLALSHRNHPLSLLLVVANVISLGFGYLSTLAQAHMLRKMQAKMNCLGP